MIKSVVTGGAGFIGSHLVEELLNRGHYVVVIDNLTTGKIDNLANVIHKPAVEFVNGTVTDSALLTNKFADATYIFHMAAISSIPHSIESPLETFETNVGGTLAVLTTATKMHLKKVIYVSSAAVYGNGTIGTINETLMTQPLSPYAASKLAGEAFCEAFYKTYNLPTVSLRYFNVYGPRQNVDSHYANVIPQIIMKILTGNQPIIFGDGEQTRDFIFVKDIVSATIMAADGPATGIFNVASGESTSINCLANLILHHFNSNLIPIHEEPKAGEVRHSLANIQKVRDIGFHPHYTLEKGLTDTIHWYSLEYSNRVVT